MCVGGVPQHTDADHSAAYVVLETDAEGGLERHGITFTLGKGTEVGELNIFLKVPECLHFRFQVWPYFSLYLLLKVNISLGEIKKRPYLAPLLVVTDRLQENPWISAHFSAELWGPELGKWLRDRRGADVHSHSTAYRDVYSEGLTFQNTSYWVDFEFVTLWPRPPKSISELSSGKSWLCRVHPEPWIN